MKHLNKLVPVFFTAMLGMTAMTGCEGGDLYNVDAPDWTTDKADSIAASKVVEEVELEGMMEDVYTIGATDFSSGWWKQFSKQYIVPDGETWNAQFTLNINSEDNTYYKNFALVISNDEYTEIGIGGYSEYGAFRFDATNDTITWNSQWSINYTFPFKYTDCTMTLSPDDDKLDANAQKLAGKVTLTVDRSNPNQFSITMQNSSCTKTYVQPYPIGNLNSDTSNTNIRCFLCVEGSYIEFISTNIEPIGGCTSATDKEPISITLNNVPAKVPQGTTLEEAVAGITATIEFEENISKEVTAEDLIFTSIPDLTETGEKTLIVIYNKTYKGANATTPVMAYATFNVVTEIESIRVIEQPTNTNYVFALNKPKGIGERLTAFDATGLVVEATYTNGDVLTMDNADLTFEGVPEKAGTQSVTMYTENGKTATVDVNVEITCQETETTIVDGVFTPSTIGLEDNTGIFWSDFIDDQKVAAGETIKFTFTNYSSQALNWNNFVVIPRDTTKLVEYAVVRADNYGWGGGYGTCTLGCTAGINWASWLAVMNGAKVTVYVTNYGDGMADVNAWMVGTNGITYFQYYYGIAVDADDLNVSFTVDGCHLVAAE